MSNTVLAPFRSNESTCGLAYSPLTNAWLTGDNLGTVYQCYSHDDGKMNTVSEIADCDIVSISISPMGDEIAIGKSNEVDIYTLPDLNVKDNMIARCPQHITHLEHDNDGGHM